MYIYAIIFAPLISSHELIGIFKDEAEAYNVLGKLLINRIGVWRDWLDPPLKVVKLKLNTYNPQGLI